MPKFPSSIRQKIILGYVLSITVIIVGAMFTYTNLRIIENKIILGNIISELFETTLEIRRFEKNFFLYKEDKDYLEVMQFIDKARKLIATNKERFKRLATMSSIYKLENTLIEYKGLIEEKALIQNDIILEERVREKGRELVTIAQNMSDIIRERIQTLLFRLQRFIKISIIFLIIIGVVSGYVVLRTITHPLKLLEESVKKISGGQIKEIIPSSSDREIVLLSEAFTRTLKELDLEYKRFTVQSDKLASLGIMISGVAHQLNNPLSNISTSCQILIEEVEESDVNTIKEILQEIEVQVERAKTMVYSLLEFSKKKEFKSELLLLKDLVEDIMRLIRGDIPTRVELTVNIPEDIYIIADKQRMQGAILNILKNAIDAIPDEGKVSISAEEYKDTKTVEIKIQDTGLGIEPDDSKKIFEPFFTTKGHGTGLGLFVTREIVQEHGGTITMDSVIGQGTTFTIKLPTKEL